MQDRKQIEQDVRIAHAHVQEIRRRAGEGVPLSDSRLRVARAIEALMIVASRDETDQGYSNHETFCVAMQLAGNMTPGGRDYHERVVALARMRREVPLIDLADALREHVEGLDGSGVSAALGANTIASDLVASALERVDWRELAAEQLEQLAEHELAQAAEHERREDEVRGYGADGTGSGYSDGTTDAELTP